MKELICIVCPKGCHLKVDDENGYLVTGNDCPRGEKYGKTELMNPTRVVTSTVKISGADIPRMPVKTDCPIPKNDIFIIMDLLNNIQINAPIKCGDIILPNILNSNINIVSTRTLNKIH